MSRWNPNEYEVAFINVIRQAQKYVKGELEIVKEYDGWYAKDYKENYKASFTINKNGYENKPLISNYTAQKYNVNVIKCCDYCNVYYVD